MLINALIAYAVYLLGAGLFILDLVAKYQKIAEANPDPKIQFNARTFWRKERINIFKIFLIGVATQILVLPFSGMSVDFINAHGDKMFNTSIKVILLPLYLVIGWGGGSATIAVAGQYKKVLYEKVGITDTKGENT